MGKRSRGPFVEVDGTEPVEGVETKGKVFFEKPLLCLVGKADDIKPHYYPVGRRVDLTPNEPQEDRNAKIGRVRLMSSRNLPICDSPPESVEYGLSQYPTFGDVKEYLREKRIEGYGQGAVVVRKYQAKWRFKSPHQWGIILYEIASPMGHVPWAPYNVTWFSEEQRVPGGERAWAEDLLIIHSHLDDTYITDILISQGANIDKA